MSTLTLSPIETLAQEIEDWGEGWRFMWNPDDRGNRARIVRPHESGDESIRIEIEIIKDRAIYLAYVLTSVRMADGHWQNVSTSVRNLVSRKALDQINAVLDGLEGT